MGPGHEAEKCFLANILSSGGIAQDAQAGGVYKAGVTLNELGEGISVVEIRIAVEQIQIGIAGELAEPAIWSLASGSFHRTAWHLCFHKY
jgi:hypothetical protein